MINDPGLPSYYRQCNEGTGHSFGCARGAGADCSCGFDEPANCVMCDAPDYLGCHCGAPYMTESQRSERCIVLTFRHDGRELQHSSWVVGDIKAAQAQARAAQDAACGQNPARVYRLRYMRRDEQIWGAVYTRRLGAKEDTL